MAGEGDLFHSDCYRTRGSYDVRPYEDLQPVELDLLLLAVHNEGVATPQTD